MDDLVELRAALVQRPPAPVLTRELQQVEGEEDDGRLGHHLPAGVLAAQAPLQRREGHHSPILPGEDLPVEHAARGKSFLEGGVQLRKVGIERPRIPALNVHIVRSGSAEYERAKAVELRLECKPGIAGDFLGESGQHRFDRRREHRDLLASHDDTAEPPASAIASPRTGES